MWGRIIPVDGAIASPQADAIQRGVLCLREMASAVWAVTQSRGPGGCSFSAFPGATNPRLPQASLANSVLPLPEPKVSGCQQNFVHWPFKRLSESPAASPWQTETLLLFTAGRYLGSFLALVL